MVSWPWHNVITRLGPLEAGAIADGPSSDAGALVVRVPFSIPWPFFCGVASSRGFGRGLRGFGVRLPLELNPGNPQPPTSCQVRQDPAGDNGAEPQVRMELGV